MSLPFVASDLKNPVQLVGYRKCHLPCPCWNRQHQPLTSETAGTFGRQQSQGADQVRRGKPGRLQGGGGFSRPSPSQGLHPGLTRTHLTKAGPSAASSAAPNRDPSGHTPNYVAWLPVSRAKQRDTGSPQTSLGKHRERRESEPGDPRWGGSAEEAGLRGETPPPCSSLIGGDGRPEKGAGPRALTSEDRKGGGAAAARAPGTRAAQAARIAGSRSATGTGSRVCVWNRIPGTRPR